MAKGDKKNKKSASDSSDSGKQPRITVTEVWDELLRENEKLAKKKGETPLTDDQLREEMQERFPDKADKTTITRVSMVRGCYNKGTNMFASRYEGEVADGDNRPISFAYYEDDDGDIQKREPRKGSSVGEPSEEKPAKKEKKEKPGKGKKGKGKGKGKKNKKSDD